MLKIVEKTFLFVICVTMCCLLVSCSVSDVNLPVNSGSDSTIENSTSVPVDSTVSTEQPKQVGTRLNPIPVGETATFDGMENLFYNYKVELTVTDVVRGDDAWAIVKKGNQFNKKPESGKEYILVKFKIKVLESVDDKKADLNNAQFTFVSASGTTYDDFVTIAGVKPELTDMYAGAESEGYAYDIVDIGDKPLVVFHEGFDGEVWFATE